MEGSMQRYLIDHAFYFLLANFWSLSQLLVKLFSEELLREQVVDLLTFKRLNAIIDLLPFLDVLTIRLIEIWNYDIGVLLLLLRVHPKQERLNVLFLLQFQVSPSVEFVLIFMFLNWLIDPVLPLIPLIFSLAPLNLNDGRFDRFQESSFRLVVSFVIKPIVMYQVPRFLLVSFFGHLFPMIRKERLGNISFRAQFYRFMKSDLLVEKHRFLFEEAVVLIHLLYFVKLLTHLIILLFSMTDWCV